MSKKFVSKIFLTLFLMQEVADKVYKVDSSLRESYTGKRLEKRIGITSELHYHRMCTYTIVCGTVTFI